MKKPRIGIKGLGKPKPAKNPSLTAGKNPQWRKPVTLAKVYDPSGDAGMDNPPEPVASPAIGDVAELIERLRKVSNFLFDNDGYEQSKTVDEAASHLAALQQERDQLIDICEGSQASWTTCDKQRAELVRLAALGKMQLEAADAQVAALQQRVEELEREHAMISEGD